MCSERSRRRCGRNGASSAVITVDRDRAVGGLGPLLAPYGENDIVGTPYTTEGLFGTDYLGQDV